MKRILVIQMFRLGDLIQTTPLLAGLRAKHPSARIDLLIPDGLERVVAGNPAVSRVIPFPAAEAARLARRDDPQAVAEALAFLNDWIESLPRDYDRVVTVSYDELSGALSWLTGLKALGTDLTADGCLVFRGDWPAYYHTFINEPSPNSFHLSDLFCLAAGVDPSAPGERFVIRPEDDQVAGEVLRSLGTDPDEELIVVHASASNPVKCWPEERFVELGRALVGRGFTVVLTGTSAERSQAAELARAVGPGAVNAAGLTDLGCLAALLNRVEAVIGNDTGPTHLAAYLGRPTMTIFLGHHPPRATGPYGPGNVALAADLDCAPCADKYQCPHDHRCREAIGVADVLAGLEVLLGRPFERPGDSGARIYQAYRAEDGLMDWRALTPDPDADLTAAWRRVWLGVLSPGRAMSAPPIDESRPPRHEKLILADVLAQRAVAVAGELLAALETGRGGAELTLAADRLNRLESQLDRLGRTTPILKPLAVYFSYRLAGLDETDPAALVSDRRRLYLKVQAAVRLLDRELENLGAEVLAGLAEVAAPPARTEVRACRTSGSGASRDRKAGPPR